MVAELNRGFGGIIGSVDESWDGIIFAANAILQWGDEWYSSVVSSCGGVA